MKIWVGSIAHEFGSNMYADRTQAGLLAQFAAFCREHGSKDIQSADDAECVDLYFTENDSETLDYGETELLG